MSLLDINPTKVDSEESDSDVQCYNHGKHGKKTKSLGKHDNADDSKSASEKTQNPKRKRADGHKKKDGKESDGKKAKLSLIKKTEKKKRYANLAEVFGDDESLNETSDFSGGFTPYRRAAQNLTKNSEVVKEKEQNKKQKKKKTSAAESVECENEKRNSSKSKEDSSEECNKESNLESSLDDKQKQCRVCGCFVNIEKLQDHFKECLQVKYANKKEIPSVSSDMKSAPEGSTIILCQICQEDISSLKVEARIEHVNECMDGKRTVGTDNVKTADPSMVNMSKCCPSCQKDLTSLNNQRRLQHINHCLDKDGKEKVSGQVQENEERNVLEQARNKVLDCPLCGQPLKTSAARKTHLKRCASKFNITTQTLMQRVKDQEEEYNIKLAAGILPEPSRRQATSKRKKTKTDTLARIPNGPTSLLEEQTQLALALSSSLHEDKGRENTTAETSLESVLQPEQMQNLNAFSILMSPKKKEPAPKRRRKRQKDTVPDLLLLSEDEMAKRMAERISEVVLTKLVNEDMQEAPPLKPSRLSGYGNTANLWTKTALVDVDSKMDKETFYVKELTPPIEICKTSAGSKMKRLSCIPGRGNTSQEKKEYSSKVQSSSKLNETTIIASTQTAVLLAELEEDVNTTVQCQTQSGTKTSQKSDTNSVNLDATGFILEPETQEYPIADHLQKLTDNLCSMVNNIMLSDITIKVKGGELIHAHKFMLAARCPQLLQATGSSGSVNFNDNSKNAILSVLKYLYAADKNFPFEVIFEVQAIAKRLKLNDLQLTCEEIIEKNDLEEKSADVTCDRDLNEFLKEMWSSDEEEVEESGPKSDTEDGDKKDEIDELYEFVASQKSKKAKSDSEHESSSDSETNDLRPSKKLCTGVEEKSEQNVQMDRSVLGKSLSLSTQEKEKSERLSESDILTKLDSSFDKPFSQGMVQEFDTSFNETHVEEEMMQEVVESKSIDVDAEDKVEKDTNAKCRNEEDKNGNTWDVTSNISTYQKKNDIKEKEILVSDDENQGLIDDKLMKDSFSENSEGDNDILNSNVNVADLSFSESDQDDIGIELTEYDDKMQIEDRNIGREDKKHKEMDAMLPDSQNYGIDTQVPSGNLSIQTPITGSSPVVGATEVTPDIFGPTPKTHNKNSNAQINNSKYAGSPVLGKKKMLKIKGTRLLTEKEDDDPLEDLSKYDSGEEQSNVVCLDSDKEDDGMLQNDLTHEMKDDIVKNSLEESIELSFEKDIYSSPKFADREVLISQDELQQSPKFDSPLHEVDNEYPTSYSPLHADLESPVLQGKVSNSSGLTEKSPCLSGKESPIFEIASTEKQKDDSEENLSLNLNESTTSVPSPVFSNSLRHCNEPYITTRQRVLSEQFYDDSQAQEISEEKASTGEKTCDEDEGADDIVNEIIEDEQKKCDRKKIFKFKRTKPVSQHLHNRKSSESEEKGSDISIDLTAEDSGSPKAPIDEDFKAANEDELEDIGTADEVKEVVNEDDTHAFIGDDIWDDFDDMGCMDQFDLQSQPKSKPNSQSKPSSQTNQKDGNQSFFDPPTDMDESCLETPQSVYKEKNTKENVMATPLPPKGKSKTVKKKLIPPSPFTPMANYDDMVTPELKKACGRYGVKPLPKKKMKEVLKNIYTETHQYETDSDIDIDEFDEIQGQKSNTNQLKPIQKRGKYDFDEKSVTSGNSSMEDDQDSERSQSDCVVMEESYLIRDSDSDETDEKDEKETSNKCSKETKRKRILEYIKKNESLYIKILHYEPLELDLFRDELKENGIRVGIDIIMDTLDEQNIQFTMRNARKGKTMHKKRGRKGFASSQAPSTNMEDQI